MSKFRIEDYMQIGGYIEKIIWVFTKYPCISRRFTKSPTFTSRRFSKSHEHGEVDDTGIY